MMLLRRAFLSALLLASNSALAQPSQKSMQIIVPFAPGASADGIARTIANERQSGKSCCNRCPSQTSP